MASFSIPLTGLRADSTALNTIANDLANMNTTAFKAETTNFSDLFYQQIGSTGSGDPIQVGAGTKVASNMTDFTSGTPNSTGVASDVALQGNGFFVVSNGNSQYLTRAGDFTQDTSGNLVTTNGLSVMGYPAVNGVVNTNAPLTAISIPLVGQVQQPSATTTMSMTANLDNTTPAGTQYPAQLTVYDSLGEPHLVTVTFEPGATANTWTYSAALPASDYSTTGGNVAPAAITGTLTFDQNGNLIQVQPTGAATPSNVGAAAGDVQSIALDFNPAANNVLADGAAGLNIQWNLLGANGMPNISQVYTSSAVSGTLQNGYTSGTFQSFAINSDGTVTAKYNNGQNQTVGQIALANVTNLQGLQLVGDGDYATTLASGTAVIGTSGTSGLGTMEGGALEASNVNISTEFSNLIVAQRAFEANAKSVTTFDTVTQDTINMVH